MSVTLKYPPPLLRTPLRKNCSAYVDAVWHGKSPDLTLSNGEGIVLPAATVPLLLSLNHHRDGRTDIDDGNRGNQPSVAFPLKIEVSLILAKDNLYGLQHVAHWFVLLRDLLAQINLSLSGSY